MEQSQMEAVGCLFCSQPGVGTAIEENGFTGRRCRTCGLIFISPRPTLAQIVNLYGHDESGISAEQHIADSHLKRLYARHNLRKIQRFAKGGRLLEIGAGAGGFLQEARLAGFDVHGIELNAVLAAFVRERQGIPCDEAPFQPSSFAGATFDVIYQCDVLSHFFDPIAELTQMRHRLNDGGVLALETGNFADVDAKYYESIGTFLYPEHLFFFGTQSLRELLKRAGLRPLAFHHSSLVPYYRWRALGQGVGRRYAHVRHEVLPRWRVVQFLKKQRDVRRARAGGDAMVAGVAGAAKAAVPAMPGRASWSTRASDYCTYFSRYELGRFGPKRGRPQTILVIATTA
jgi:SAM-dependent methyltransferase